MLQDRLAQTARQVQAHVDDALAPLGTTEVVQAMRYAMQGGKRLRAFLVMESAGLFDIPASQSIWPASAIEAIHCYSLIHDDLPCMDDDSLRRGQPTVHIKWDEATAVLAGDALQSIGFEWCLNPATSPSSDVRTALALGLSQAAGAQGMVLGQALDIAAETANVPLSLDQITELQQGKTGALIKWSATAGAVLANQDTAPLATYADAIGLAFQIADDILDIEGDAEKAGKRLNKDAEAGKATFVSLLGLDGAKQRARELVSMASDTVSVYGERANSLQDAAAFIISRDN